MYSRSIQDLLKEEWVQDLFTWAIFVMGNLTAADSNFPFTVKDIAILLKNIFFILYKL